MSEAEVHALFDRPFPRGFAGQDVLDEIAPEGWERSPLLACFHPSIERIFEERLLKHRNLEELRRMRRRRDGQRGGRFLAGTNSRRRDEGLRAVYGTTG